MHGLHSLGVRVLFRVNAAARRLEAARIESELGTSVPGDASWGLATKLALCAATSDVSMARHFNGVHLAAGGLLAIATRSCLPATHPLRRLLWPHMFGTQFSNELVTKGQMSPGGEFDSIFSLTHRGMCALFTETWAAYDITVLDPHRDAERRGIAGAGFDTPALANRAAHFDVMHAHAQRYLALYYASDAALRDDPAVAAWAEALDRTVPGGIRTLAGDTLTVASTGPAGRRVHLHGHRGARAPRHRPLELSDVDSRPAGARVPERAARAPRRVPAAGQRELQPERHRAPLLQDFGYLALDAAGAAAFAQFKRELDDLQRRIESEPAAAWKVSPAILEANINA